MKSIIIFMMFFIIEIAPGKVTTFQNSVFFTAKDDVKALRADCLQYASDDLMHCIMVKTSLTESEIKNIKDKSKNTLCCWAWAFVDCIDEQLAKNTSCSDDEKNDIRSAKSRYITDVETANCQDHKYKDNTYSQCSGTSPVTYNIITMLILLTLMKLFK